jgi:nicotinamidase-related amidase
MKSIDRTSSLLLVHDVVNKYLTDEDPDMASMLKNIERLLMAARNCGMPIAFAAPGQGDPAIGMRASVVASGRSDWGTPSVDLPSFLGPGAGEIVFRKPRYGAFYGSSFDDHLKRTGRRSIIICGLSLAGGVETTVRDADNRDFESLVVSDACLCRPIPDQGWGTVTSAEVAKVTLSIMAQRFALIATTDEICAALR